MISQSASNCSCLLAAIFITPSAVLNVPDGLAVKLSLPFGMGAFPAIRWFDTTQPIVAITASSIETSIKVPRSSALLARAAATAKAAVMPPIVSPIG